MWDKRYNTSELINTLSTRQNGRRFGDDPFRCIFLDENVWNLIEISLNFVLKGQYPLAGAKPLSEQMMVSSNTVHIT